MEPKLGKNVFLAPTSSLIGNVTLKDHSSVWFSSVLRADGDSIEIGNYSNVQDNVSIHADPNFPVKIGEYVSIGHNAVIHGCTIEDCVIIGMGAVVMNGAIIGKGSIIGAASVVKTNQVIPPHSLVMGVPAKVVKQDEKLYEYAKNNAEVYLQLVKLIRDGTYKVIVTSKL